MKKNNFKIKKVYLSVKQGFTLIELLIVIAIIGILAGVILVNTNGAKQKAHKSSFKKETRGAYSALANNCTTTGNPAAVSVPANTANTTWGAFTTACSSNGNFSITATPVDTSIVGCTAIVNESGVSYTAGCN